MIYHNQKASPVLCSHYMRLTFLTMHSVPFHADPNAPDNWQELKNWANGNRLGHDSLPVFNGACDQSIYNSADDNIMFRAWHDTLHIKNNLGFSLESEVKVARLHVDDMRAIRVPYNVIQTIYIDVIAQVVFYYKTGEFVKDQNGFIEFIIKNGLNSINDYKN